MSVGGDVGDSGGAQGADGGVTERDHDLGPGLGAASAPHPDEVAAAA